LRRQRQIPSRIVRDPGRIVKLVGVGMWQRLHRLETPQMAQQPVFLEKRNVCDLPSQWVYDQKARPHHLLVVEIFYKVEQPASSLCKFRENLSYVGRTHRSNCICATKA